MSNPQKKEHENTILWSGGETHTLAKERPNLESILSAAGRAKRETALHQQQYFGGNLGTKNSCMKRGAKYRNHVV
jgi:hypothetical protein